MLNRNVLDKIYSRVEFKITEMVEKLRVNNGMFEKTVDELKQECVEMFYNKFEEYYETDSQYCSFLYICMRNRIRNIRRSMNVRNKHETNDISILHSAEDDLDYGKIWGNIPDPKSVKQPPFNIEQVFVKVSPVAQEVIEHIICGKTKNETAKSMGVKVKQIEEILNGEVLEAIKLSQ